MTSAQRAEDVNDAERKKPATWPLTDAAIRGALDVQPSSKMRFIDSPADLKLLVQQATAQPERRQYSNIAIGFASRDA
jgi:hypothetical protein